jgi:hypothetical protein
VSSSSPSVSDKRTPRSCLFFFYIFHEGDVPRRECPYLVGCARTGTVEQMRFGNWCKRRQSWQYVHLSSIEGASTFSRLLPFPRRSLILPSSSADDTVWIWLIIMIQAIPPWKKTGWPAVT